MTKMSRKNRLQIKKREAKKNRSCTFFYFEVQREDQHKKEI
jgi:hypothetical protein